MTACLYETLGLAKNATPLEIKKAYKRLSLQYHPDKIQQRQSKGSDTDFTFSSIQFSYSILSDPVKRRRYDSTGSLGTGYPDGDDAEGAFDWKAYFEEIQTKIDISMIEEDRQIYKQSKEERDDVLHNFIYYEGDFLRLFEVIPHLEFDEEEESRIFAMIEDSIKCNDLVLDASVNDTWNDYKKRRKTKVKQMLRKMAKEAKEAEKVMLSMKNSRQLKGVSCEGDLKALIQNKNKTLLENLISSLEAKYVHGKKRKIRDEGEGSKRKK